MTPGALLRSPLVHFFAIGAFFFAAYAALDDGPPAPAPGVIEITPATAARLEAQFASAWRRPPTAEERDRLLRAWALEEAYVREARRLGLDRDDRVIRHRLATKMAFLADAGAAALAPDDAALQAFLDENPELFERPARTAFEQVPLPAEADAAAIARIRAALENGAAPPRSGGTWMLPAAMPLSPPAEIDRRFGNGFDAALEAAPQGRWHGPVEGAYGRHLVRVTAREAPGPRPLAAIRERVEAEWRAARAREMNDAFGAALLARYEVILPDTSADLPPEEARGE